jgi:hypothetical protein
MSIFEFDFGKSELNEKRHEINFIDAQRIWNDDRLVEIFARSEDEARFLIIGSVESKLWSAIVTYRNDAIRIISMRRAREEEVQLYES